MKPLTANDGDAQLLLELADAPKQRRLAERGTPELPQ
jgi:hypothetical protein